MSIKAFVGVAALLAAVSGAARPAFAGWWPWYSYYGYDYRFGYYGSPAAGPMYFYVPPAKPVYIEPVIVEPACVTRKSWVAGRWKLVCS
jgi:hypothetical protein